MKKEWNVLAFFRKRTKRSPILLRSLQKNVAFFAKELCVLLGLLSRQKLKKERKRTERSCQRTECTEQKRTQCPTLVFLNISCYIAEIWITFWRVYRIKGGPLSCLNLTTVPLVFVRDFSKSNLVVKPVGASLHHALQYVKCPI